MPAIKQKQSLNQSLSPQQILQTLILQLNTNSLEDKVFEELESNPLLEHSDDTDQEENFDSKDESKIRRKFDPATESIAQARVR